MAATPASPADALIHSADRAGEKTAQSAFDKTFQNFSLPEDPSKLGKQYGDAAASLYDSLGIGGALESTRGLTEDSAVADAASMFENRTKREELAKTPVSDLDSEINRLTEQRWGILPAVLGRSDIIDYGAKLKIAGRAQDILDGEINKLVTTRQSFADAADSRAKDRIDEMKATASFLDKRSQAAQNDLNSRIDLFKAGQGTFDDVVQAALELRKANDAKAKAAAGGNSMIGMGTGSGSFTPGEIASFGYFEKFGDFPVADSSKIQVKQALTQRYAAWVQAGRPGSKITTTTPAKPLPPGVSGPQAPPITTTMDISDVFKTPAGSRATGFASLFAPAPGAPVGGGAPLPEPGDGEVTDYYSPPGK